AETELPQQAAWRGVEAYPINAALEAPVDLEGERTTRQGGRAEPDAPPGGIHHLSLIGFGGGEIGGIDGQREPPSRGTSGERTGVATAKGRQSYNHGVRSGRLETPPLRQPDREGQGQRERGRACRGRDPRRSHGLAGGLAATRPSPP